MTELKMGHATATWLFEGFTQRLSLMVRTAELH
jgi:hypothetical protein